MTERAPFPIEAEGLVVTIDDVRKAGHCTRGARAWFNQHGLDFRAFLAGGIDARTFWEKGDALSAIIVRRTLARRGEGA